MAEVIKYTLGDDNRGNPPKVAGGYTEFEDVTRSIRVCAAPGCPNGDPKGFVHVSSPGRPDPITKFD